MQYPNTHVITPVGMIASWKDFIADLIRENFAIPKATVSDILRRKVEEEWGDVGNRQALIDMSNRLTQEHNWDGAVLARMTMSEAETKWVSELQIVGMRQSPQMLFLMKNVGRLTSLFLHSHNIIRYDRYCSSKMARWEPTMDYEAFIRSEIEQNTGSNNDLYNLAKLCRYHWLPDGRVLDIWIKEDTPESLPKYDAQEYRVLLSQNPDALKEWLWGETIIDSLEPMLATPESHRKMNEQIQLDPKGELATKNANRTKIVIRLILWYSRVWYQYLEEYSRGMQ